MSEKDIENTNPVSDDDNKETINPQPEDNFYDGIEIVDADEDDESDNDNDDDIKITQLEKSLDDSRNSYLRLMAEYDNFRKRTAKEKTEIYGDAIATAVSEILPVIDNFERALSSETTDLSFKDGVQMIFNQLIKILGNLGVTEMEAIGKEFDPNFHHAIKQISSDEFEESTICEVFQKGYMLGSRIIRPAMVAVTN